MDHSKFILFFLMIAAILTTADIYFYFGIKSRLSKKWKIVYLTFSAISFAFIMFGSYNYFTGQKSSIFVRTYLWGSFMFVYLSKLIGCLWIIADDLRRLFIWTKAKVTADKETTKDGITRKNSCKWVPLVLLAFSLLPFFTECCAVATTTPFIMLI